MSAESIPDHILNRKGARTTASVPREVRELLNAGRLESANLSEWLIVDHDLLARTVLKNVGCGNCLDAVCNGLSTLKTQTALKKTFVVGSVLAESLITDREFRQTLRLIQVHPSDTVRSWGCAMIGRRESLTLANRLKQIRPFAADVNMGVREIAWMAVRPHIEAQLSTAIEQLTIWARDSDDRIRRFSSELTRPRGVWCQHLQALKDNPKQALPILSELMSDGSKYVRDSVSNWLNDASKSQPDFVEAVCLDWLNRSSSAETLSTVKRAVRTLHKSGKLSKDLKNRIAR